MFSWSLECDSGHLVSSQQSQPHGVTASRGNLAQSVLCLPDPCSGHVHHCGELGDPSLCFTLPGQQGMGGRRPLHFLGWLRPNLCLPTSSNSPQDPPKDQHNSDPHRFTTPVSTMALSATSAQPSSSHTADRHCPVPVHSQPLPPSVPQRPSPVASSCVALIRDLLR